MPTQIGYRDPEDDTIELVDRTKPFPVRQYGPNGEVVGAGSPAVTMADFVPSITTSSATVLASNPDRTYALLQNDGAVDVYLRIGATAVINRGIRLLANGGSYEMSAAFGNLDTRVINGITVAGTAVVLVTEGS